MSIQKNSVVSLHYEMYDADNNLLDKTQEPIEYLHGGYDGIFPLVEEALHDKNVGDEVDITMQPEDAFGEQDPELVRIEDVKVFPVEVEPGMMFEADDPRTRRRDYLPRNRRCRRQSRGGRQSPARRHENPLQRHGCRRARSQRRRNRPRPCAWRTRASPLIPPIKAA